MIKSFQICSFHYQPFYIRSRTGLNLYSLNEKPGFDIKT